MNYQILQLTNESILWLTPGDKESIRVLIANHLKKMKPEDRYLRFFSSINDNAIDSYVERIDFFSDGVFVVFDETGLEIKAFLHASCLSKKSFDIEYEIGITVDDDLRGKGIAYELFSKAMTWAKSLGCKRIYVNCLRQNKAMQKIAEKFNIETKSLDYETKEGELKMPDNTVSFFSYFTHKTNNNMVLIDLAYRKNVHMILEYLEELKTIAKGI